MTNALASDVGRTPPNLAWLVRLRWLAVLSQGAAVVLVWSLLDLQMAAGPLLGVVALTALSNIALTLWMKRAPHVEEWLLASVMALDFFLLTALLYLSGGPGNPFTVLFLVHIALAAVVLKQRYAWALSLLASACFFALFMLPMHHSELDHAMAMHSAHGASSTHGEAPMSLHLRGMWVAFFVAATVITYVVTRVTRDLEQQRGAAALAHTRALRSERLAALATLAAGAAHELATPLGTIAVVAKELERDLSKELQASASVADAKLIREEVERCKHILAQMASDAGESAGEAFATLSARTVIDMALEDVADAARVEVNIAEGTQLRVPPRAWARAFRGLIRNALQASTTAVTVRVERDAHAIIMAVIDRGAGMSEQTLARVGEPFFTTKETGRGMGLGVFLARALAERMGGTLELKSRVDEGTTVRVVLPQHTRDGSALKGAS